MFLEVDCGQLPTPMNGTKTGNVTIYASVMMFSCNFGHNLTGSSVRTCQQNGTWSGIEPICNGQTFTSHVYHVLMSLLCSVQYCEDPGIPSNGTRDSNSTVYGSVIKFSCTTEFQLVGNDSIQCVETSRDPVLVAWNHPPPTCDSK